MVFYNTYLWIGFFVSIVVLLLLSSKNLGLALISGGITLGLFAWSVSDTIHFSDIIFNILGTIQSPSVLLLAIAMGVIPVIGGVLSKSGKLDDMVNNLRIGKKPFLGLAPALVGLLPMPGGALLSAPLVEKAGEGVDDKLKAAINIWFRHMIILVYPLFPELIIATRMVGLEVYDVLPYLALFFLLLGFIGIVFFLMKIKGVMQYKGRFSLIMLSRSLVVFLLAPVIDFSLRRIFDFKVPEICTLIAVLSSLVLSILFSRNTRNGEQQTKINIIKITKKAKAWNFSLIVIGMFIFLNMFKMSGIGDLIADLAINKVTLCVIIGFLFSFGTGRLQLSVSIILPIFLTNYGVTSMPVLTFVFTYFSMFLGYMVSPLHPCIPVSLEYFNIRLKDFFAVVGIPALLSFTVVLILALFFI